MQHAGPFDGILGLSQVRFSLQLSIKALLWLVKMGLLLRDNSLLSPHSNANLWLVCCLAQQGAASAFCDLLSYCNRAVAEESMIIVVTRLGQLDIAINSFQYETCTMQGAAVAALICSRLSSCDTAHLRHVEQAADTSSLSQNATDCNGCKENAAVDHTTADLANEDSRQDCRGPSSDAKSPALNTNIAWKAKPFSYRHCNLKFAILGSGYVLRGFEDWLAETVKIPALHVYREHGDRQLPSSESEKLLNCFDPKSTKVFRHSKGHTLPADKVSVRHVRSFLEQLL